ncbi:OsmC family protein [bacterium]|nr:osmotically inducible protein OsmC [bacterium]MBU3956485.1 OsmC family protein [bacterium]
MKLDIVFPGGKKVDVLYHGFRIQSDQPVEDGGENSAPSPYDLFLSSIAACAGYYVIAFCAQRGISSEGLKMTMNCEKNIETRTIGKIDIAIKLPAGFPDKYKNAVVKAAESCGVKKHFVYPPVFSIFIES